MKTLVISKPVYDYILPLVEFPADGDKFNIEKAINSMSNYGSVVALVLGKYGVDVNFSGVVGEDDVAKKIKDIFRFLIKPLTPAAKIFPKALLGSAICRKCNKSERIICKC